MRCIECRRRIWSWWDLFILVAISLSEKVRPDRGNTGEKTHGEEQTKTTVTGDYVEDSTNEPSDEDVLRIAQGLEEEDWETLDCLRGVEPYVSESDDHLIALGLVTKSTEDSHSFWVTLTDLGWRVHEWIDLFDTREN